jgi:hypothetical protein
MSFDLVLLMSCFLSCLVCAITLAILTRDVENVAKKDGPGEAAWQHQSRVMMIHLAALECMHQY